MDLASLVLSTVLAARNPDLPPLKPALPTIQEPLFVPDITTRGLSFFNNSFVYSSTTLTEDEIQQLGMEPKGSLFWEQAGVLVHRKDRYAMLARENFFSLLPMQKKFAQPIELPNGGAADAHVLLATIGQQVNEGKERPHSFFFLAHNITRYNAWKPLYEAHKDDVDAGVEALVPYLTLEQEVCTFPRSVIQSGRAPPHLQQYQYKPKEGIRGEVELIRCGAHQELIGLLYFGTSTDPLKDNQMNPTLHALSRIFSYLYGKAPPKIGHPKYNREALTEYEAGRIFLQGVGRQFNTDHFNGTVRLLMLQPEEQRALFSEWLKDYPNRFGRERPQN